jgi:all-trans-8'-apo-beta-carotenal 15,15'-oxygenase
MQTVMNESAERRGSRAWAHAMTNVTREHGFEKLRVEGTIPRELVGTYFRNGPGLVELFGRPYGHWFDGDGLISAVRFSDGEAEGAARVLQTAGLLEERRRGKPYFGSYGTVAPGMWNPLRALRAARGSSKNPANTSVLVWNDRLLALCEAGRPFEVDPKDLSSIGQTDLGVIPRGFSAHPHRVAANGYVYNIGVEISRPSSLDLFALRPDGTAGHVVRLPLDFPTMIHDFAVTERFAVIFVAPLRLQLLPTLLGRKAFADALVWEHDRGTEVIVVPFDAPASPKRFRLDAFWAWHIGNAFERDGRIVMDMVRYRDFPSSAKWLSGVSKGGLGTGAPDGFLGRAELDPHAETLRFEQLRDRSGEFPRVAPAFDARAHRVVYWTEHSSPSVFRTSPPDTIVKVDTESGRADAYTFPEGQFPSEAVYAPRPGSDREDDGWLLSLVYDADSHTSHWAILDAARVAEGPIARAHMDHHIPLSFHGVWSPTENER